MNNGTMKAVGVLPEKKEVALLQHPTPHITAPTEVKVRTLEVGICGTDREICTFAYGWPPTDSEYLVLGHEALGEVIEVGPRVTTFKPGDLVVPTVRRPCPHAHCISCRDGRQDFCFTGDFTERGINSVHGYMTEFFVEDEAYLNAVPPGLKDVAVLVEPLTVAEKALAQLWQVQRRLNWAPGNGDLPGAGKTAVVLGAGPVGILGAMALMVRGFRTWVYNRSPEPNPKADLVNSIGAKYVSFETVPLAQFAKMTGPIDVVYEAVGVAKITFEVMKILGLNGAFIFTGIPPEKPAIPVEADTLMRRIVLMNQAIIGTVNADRTAFEDAIRDLGLFQRRWPDSLRKVISGRHPLENYREVLLGKATGIKQVFTIGG
jgi:threonine dehydrogenase-like Zn-dependent dehydrogenase